MLMVQSDTPCPDDLAWDVWELADMVWKFGIWVDRRCLMQSSDKRMHEERTFILGLLPSFCLKGKSELPK